MEATTSTAARSTGKFVWKLKQGEDIVYLRPTRRRMTSVVGGTLFGPGDCVGRPAGLSWEEALELKPDGDTRLSPRALELVFEERTRRSVIGPLPAALPPDERLEREYLARDVLAMFETDAFEYDRRIDLTEEP